MITLLEWFAFGGSLFSVWLYGQSPKHGPYAGIAVSILFMVYGWAAGIPAAALSNVVFFVLHARNLIKARKNDMSLWKKRVKEGFAFLAKEAHGIAKESGWWDDFHQIEEHHGEISGAANQIKGWFIGAKLALVHTEVSEAVEGHRKGIMDDHLPHRSMLEVELAYAVIRIADLGEALGLDVAGAISEKMEYNSTRPDHKKENREAAGGKGY